MLKKFYLSKSEIELIQIALGEMVISEKKKEKENRSLIDQCKAIIGKLEGNTENEKNSRKKKI